jgi:hypothetical protein
MNARARIHAMFPLDEQAETELDKRLDEHRAEVLAADGQAYDGELAMLRGLVRTLRVVARPDDADMGEVRRLLHHHATDDAAAREEATAEAATATPDFFQPGHTYAEPGDTTDWRFRCDAITTRPADGERTALGWRHFRGEWTECAYGEDDWEIHRLTGVTEAGEDR